VRYVQYSCIHQGVFRGRAIERCQSKSTATDLVAMATNLERKLATTRLVSDIYPIYLRLAKVFRAELLNNVHQILRLNLRNLAEHWKLCARSTLDWSQSKIFLVFLEKSRSQMPRTVLARLHRIS